MQKYWCIYVENITDSCNQRSHPVLEVAWCREEWVSIRAVKVLNATCNHTIENLLHMHYLIGIGWIFPHGKSLLIRNPRTLEKRFNHPVWVEYSAIDSSLKSREWYPSLLTMENICKYSQQILFKETGSHGIN